MNSLFKYAGLFFSVMILSLQSADILISQSNQHDVVHGVVLDKDTGEPVPSVHVYISRTTVGTATLHDGTFRFSTNLSGAQKLVFSYVGYRTEIKDINFYAGNNHHFEVEITPEPIELDQVEVTASNKEWQEDFEVFERQFIGTTSLANETEIENPWVISFDRDQNGTLIAKAGRPLLVTNRALGYQIKIDLVEFEWPLNNRGYYLFHSSYKPLVPKNGGERRKWEKNRRNSYRGSFEHFLESLYEDNLNDNDFETVLANTEDVISIPRLDLPAGRLRLITGGSAVSNSRVKAYRLRLPVDVLHGEKWFSRERARSRIVPMERNGIFVVTDQGRLVNPLAVSVEGIWAGHRVANLLPVDYNNPFD